MALDGIFLRHLKYELTEKLVGGRVDKIYQPNRDELVIGIRTREAMYKLLLSSRANSARVNITAEAIENPKQPPMLCMLLRKRLQGAKLIDIRQEQLERVLFLSFEGYNELGDITEMTIAVEIMGRYSNIIFIDSNGDIIDSIKRVDEDMTSERLVLPGLPYESPPPQDKLSILDSEPVHIVDSLICSFPNKSLYNALLATLQGVSPIVCREIEDRVFCGIPLNVGNMTTEQQQGLLNELTVLKETAINHSGSPVMIIDNATDKPRDFSFIPINQYGSSCRQISYDSFSSLLDSFYRERDKIERMRVKSQALNRKLSNISERLTRKINIQHAELKECENREYYKICGDLISANIYQLEKGMASCELINFYDENQDVIRIKLDPLKTPTQNAQKYYKDYRKLKTAEEKLLEQIDNAEKELVYIDAVKESLQRAETERDISEIKAELSEQGYIKAVRDKKKQRTTAPQPPLSFTTSDGFKVFVGRNNKQNDRLTLKDSTKHDMWFHVKNHPGSHVVVQLDHKEISDTAIIEAAELAAYYSSCRESSNVPVDYTIIKNVSKPSGAKPGMVIYVNYKTVYVTPKTF